MEKAKPTVDLVEALEGYIRIPKHMWNFIPMRARLRVIKVAGEDATNESRESRFRLGGQLVSRTTTDDGADTTIILRWGTGAMKLRYSEIEELWKRYDNGAFIELHMIAASLMQKGKQIDALMAAQQDVGKKLQLLAGREPANRESASDQQKELAGRESAERELANQRQIIAEQQKRIERLEREFTRVTSLERQLRSIVSSLTQTQ